ncbi:unnamed protein product [Aureobasidium vineae]|uniref:Zn(2)-C6 fungal-type domain-containing protein n=1 Tax=Aureobasidium vineae TaxID=2773715 RepID=A0A9N8P5S0_9PEZI|nr:unnamed protein product [Aureobasidium vineae]
MPQRRSHTKSRRGCSQCKQRHVKCDESMPSCGYCLKREVVCSFIAPSNDNTPGLTASPSGRSESTTSPAPRTTETRVLELRLMHNWSTNAYKSLRQHSDETHLWQVVVPELALSHEYLLNALLALSARQISFEDPSWDWAALEYEGRALSEFQHVLGALDSSNCEAIFACSILIMVFSLAQSHWQHSRQLSDALVDILELRQFISGVGLVHRNYSDLLHLSSFGTLFNQHTPSNLDSGNGTGVPLPDMCRKSHSDAISYLQHAMSSYCTGGIMSEIMTWPATLGDEYMSLIEARDSLALAILAHYGVIIHLLRDRWWAADAGKRLVLAILPILRESQQDLADLVQRSWTAVASEQ